MRIRVHAHANSKSLSIWRSVAPLALLRRTHNADVEISRDISYDAAALTDWFFFHTPWSENHLKMLYVAKLARAKVWIDWDDNLTDVPEHNQVRHCYDNPQNEARLREMARNADLITTSTEYLREKWAQENPNVHVVPNALDDHLIPPEPVVAQHPDRVFWRGGQSHVMDCAAFAKDLTHCDLYVAGHNPQTEWRNLFYTYCGTHGFHAYLAIQRQISAGVHIVPLEDIPFNHAKSNIAWQEAILAGSIVVAPDWPEWRKPGVIHYNDKDDFGEALLQAQSTSITDREQMIAEAHKHIWDNYRLSVVNPKRAELLGL